jgi:hypothetical protein
LELCFSVAGQRTNIRVSSAKLVLNLCRRLAQCKRDRGKKGFSQRAIAKVAAADGAVVWLLARKNFWQSSQRCYQKLSLRQGVSLSLFSRPGDLILLFSDGGSDVSI